MIGSFVFETEYYSNFMHHSGSEIGGGAYFRDSPMANVGMVNRWYLYGTLEGNGWGVGLNVPENAFENPNIGYD